MSIPASDAQQLTTGKTALTPSTIVLIGLLFIILNVLRTLFRYKLGTADGGGVPLRASRFAPRKHFPPVPTASGGGSGGTVRPPPPASLKRLGLQYAQIRQTARANIRSRQSQQQQQQQPPSQTPAPSKK